MDFGKIKNNPLVVSSKKLFKEFFLKFYKNAYKTSYGRNVLISYITYPLRDLYKTHSNFLELHCILEIFKDLNFNIDVADYTLERKINYSKYDLIFGFGSPFGRAFWDKDAKKALKICYLTGSLNLFNQMARNKYLKKRKGIAVIPRRNYYWQYLQESISMSDAIVLTGNEWTKSTIEPYNSKIFTVRLPIFLPDKELITQIVQNKNFERWKKCFLWFGSYGALHKGLDLCLDVFANNKDLFLHTCGSVNREEDFFRLYERELTELPNIKYYGFLDIESPLFMDIINFSVFSIFPSCSEGTSGSLLTTMAYGLIPIATIETGIDMKLDYGILLSDYKVDYINEIVRKATKYSGDVLRKMAFKSIEYVYLNHNVEAFKEDFVRALSSIGVIK